MKDKKREYIIKTLSRTKRKDYENYVVNAIYHKLNNINIKPVSQQYVKRTDNSYALLDLYFPQLNIAIECDEEYHNNEKNKIADKKREIEVSQKLTALLENEIEIERVDVSQNLDVINQKIEKIVEKIRSSYEKIGSPVWEIIEPWEVAEKQGYVDVKDNLEFDKIEDISKIFKVKHKSQSATIHVTKGLSFLWCPKLSIKNDCGEYIQTDKKWNNIISDDRTEIFEEYIDNNINTREQYEKILLKKSPKEREIELNKLRYVFAYHKNYLGQKFYKFLGVYKLDKIEDKYAIHKKISDVVYLDDKKNINTKDSRK